MKLFKLGLLAVTLSLVAVVIALDKKNGGGCQCDSQSDLDNEHDCEDECATVIVEEKFE